MKTIELKSRSKRGAIKYSDNLKSAVVFLSIDSDRVEIKGGDEKLLMDVYENGKLIFSGDKYDFFNALRQTT